MKQKLSNLIYCARCRMTTPHEVTGNDHTCGRCGSVKRAVRVSSRRVERSSDSKISSAKQPGAIADASCSMPLWN